jgi:hypothetical protein
MRVEPGATGKGDAMQADIDTLMRGDLGRWLEQQDVMRAAAKAKSFNRWFYGAIVLVPVLAFIWFLPSAIAEPFRAFLTLAAFGGLSAFAYHPVQQAKRAVKVGINSAIARELGLGYAHDIEPGIEFKVAETYGLLPDHDDAKFEDHWSGKLEGHAFNLYEAHLTEERGSGKNRRTVTVFRGAIVQIAFGRPFTSTTLLQRAGKHKRFFGLGGRADHTTFGGHRLDYVDQVHPAFEDVFEVWSDDQVEARTIIHPSYLEHLLSVEHAFGGKAIRALFEAGQIVMAVESGNLFESGGMNASEDRARVEQAARQFGSLARLALAINQTERGRTVRALDES